MNTILHFTCTKNKQDFRGLRIPFWPILNRIFNITNNQPVLLYSKSKRCFAILTSQ